MTEVYDRRTMRLTVHRTPLSPVPSDDRRVDAGPTIASFAPDELHGGRLSENAIAFIDGVPIEQRDWAVTPTDGVRFLNFVERADGPAAAPYLISLLVSAAVSFVSALLFPPPSFPKQRDDEGSPTYSFGGLGNNRFEGLPIPVLYGELRLGGQVINNYIEANAQASPDSYLYILIALGEGQYQEIAGQTVDTPDDAPLTGSLLATMLINGNAAENFDGIEAWVRMGTLEQAPIPGFHKLFTPNTTDLGLSAEITTDKDNSAIYVVGDPFTGDYDPEWDEFGVAFDIVNEVDGAVVRIVFPQGLFAADANGGLIASYLRIQIRYIELDGSNNPITTGGPNGDGYVRREPEGLISGAQREQFSREFSVSFLDPQTWTPPVVGKALNGTGSGYATSTVSATANPYYAGATLPDGWTASVWMRLAVALPTTGATSGETMIFGNFENANNAGFQIAFKNRSSGPTAEWHLQAKVKGQAGVSSVAEDPNVAAFTVGQWYLLTMTYGRNQGNGGDDRTRLYINDVMVAEDVDNSADFRLGSSSVTRNIRFLRGFDFTNILNADLDDAIIIDKELGIGYILDRFQTLVSGPDHVDMIARWRFDDTGDALQDIIIGVDQWFSDAVVSTATSGIITGIVQSSGSGTLKPSKYRIEVLRLNYDSDNSLTSDEAVLESVTEFVDDQLSYPEIPLIGLKVKATDQLNTSEPTVTQVCKGRLVPVWDGVSTATPNFVDQYSTLPSWHAVDLLTDRAYGLGEFFNFSNIDVVSFGAWANYCAEVVYDGSILKFYNTTTSWGDIYFDAAAADGRGLLTFLWATGVANNQPPSHFRPGRFLRVHGIGTVATFDEVNNPIDADPTGVGGYEIAQGAYYNPTFSAWAVDVYWDRAGEVPWTDQTLRQTHSPALSTSDWIEGGERRFEFHGVFDEEKRAQDALQEIAMIGRASFYQVGGKIRVRYESPREPVTLIGRGSIERGSFRVEYTGPTTKPNALDYSFLSRDLDYERETWPVRDPALLNANASVQIRRESSFLFGVTSRAQVDRHGNYILNLNRLVRRSGSFDIGIEGLQLEIGDTVVLSHDIFPRGYSGRLTGTTATTTTMTVDQPFRIESGKSYKVWIKDWRNQAPVDGNDTRPVGSDLEVADLASPTAPGDYPAGTQITVSGGPGPSGGFRAVPNIGVTSYAIVADGEELVVEIIEITMNESQVRTCRWVQFEDELFNDDVAQPGMAGPGSDDGLISGSTQFRDPGNEFADTYSGGPGGDSGSGRFTGLVIPDNVLNLRIRDLTPRGRGVGKSPMLHVSWAAPSRQRSTIEKYEVYTRRHVPWIANHNGASRQASGPWRKAGEARGNETAADVQLFGIESNITVQVAVRPVTSRGVGATPERCSMRLHKFMGVSSEPRRVRNVEAVQDSGLVHFTWGHPLNLEDDTVVEIRRGGWVLGQRVLVAPPGAVETDPVEDWAGAAAGGLVPDLFFAARDSSGQFSDPRILSGFVPTTVMQDEEFPIAYAEYAWETWGDGWVDDTSPPAGDPAFDQLERNADGHAQFAAASSLLVGFYSTRNNLTGLQLVRRAQRPSLAYVEAVVVAEQVHPRTWDSEETWDGPERERWTWEGPRHIIDGEDQCTLRIQWRRSQDGVTWGDWGKFKPGRYELVEAQFRLRVTRPSTDYDVLIKSFSTRIRVPRERGQDRTQLRSYLESEIM